MRSGSGFGVLPGASHSVSHSASPGASESALQAAQSSHHTPRLGARRPWPALLLSAVLHLLLVLLWSLAARNAPLRVSAAPGTARAPLQVVMLDTLRPPPQAARTARALPPAAPATRAARPAPAPVLAALAARSPAQTVALPPPATANEAAPGGAPAATALSGLEAATPPERTDTANGAPAPGSLLGRSKAMAGPVDRLLRNGASPISAEPERKWERFAEAFAAARRGAGSGATLASYTAPDGTIIYRRTVAGRSSCYRSGSVGGLATGFGVADGRGAGNTSCPTGVRWSRHD